MGGSLEVVVKRMSGVGLTGGLEGSRICLMMLGREQGVVMNNEFQPDPGSIYL